MADGKKVATAPDNQLKIKKCWNKHLENVKNLKLKIQMNIFS